jgi:malto-oligosyltrehalose synthase/4-alpha-glucanotransferase
MYNPISTYRIQFNKWFKFNDLQNIRSYLKDLGISTIYASPVFEATPGSNHGYDGLNPLKVNPEIGTEQQWIALSKEFKTDEIGWLQDIVPNHMAFDARNPWVFDVLEKSRLSKYANFFDIDWNSTLYKGKLMVPFLSSSVEDSIKRRELEIAYIDHHLVIKNYDRYYPLNPRSYLPVLKILEKENLKNIRGIEECIQQLENLNDPFLYEAQWNNCLKKLTTEFRHDEFSVAIEKVNNNYKLLLELILHQNYILCHWQETDSRINYRRFFTVNGLICLNIQNIAVFEKFHSYTHSLLQQGLIDGLRIDHIDGLYDPTTYLEKLRKLAGEQSYIVVEKILELNEKLPESWPVQGNTGYDFLAMVNNLFTNGNAKNDFTNFYVDLTNDNREISQQIREKKGYILYHQMGGELENLYRVFMQLIGENDYDAMRTEDIRTVIAEFLINCPVYRYYGNSVPFNEDEVVAIRSVLKKIHEVRPDLSAAINLLENVLLSRTKEKRNAHTEDILHFYQRCMQISGPLMAKGVEDTLMYSYNRFIAHNDVGDSPASFGITITEFHDLMKDRQKRSPLSLNTTSTHDTKRGEDVRARLNVLTDIPEEWISAVKEWREINVCIRNEHTDVNDEYFIYQTLVGSYPLVDEPNYSERIQEYLQKALREGKRHSSWITPNQQYETATKSFAVSLLDKSKPFWKSFELFHRRIVDFGIINSLAQLILKFTCPGTPDLYQGSEYWDFSLVDPDNRRPVDYDIRQQDLKEIISNPDKRALIIELWDCRSDARIKLWLTHNLLKFRIEQQKVFEEGIYVPISIKGEYANNIFAFARLAGESAVIVVVPLHISMICSVQNKNITQLDWKDTTIVLPRKSLGKWKNILFDLEGTEEVDIPVEKIFSHLPFAILQLQLRATEVAQIPFQNIGRNAGVLLHITSLPSPFGIGDLGPEAKLFADFLRRTGQSYWQMLPVNPIEDGQGYSPYSAISSRAGNTLLISPELLQAEGLLDIKELEQYYLQPDITTDFRKAEQIKEDLFHKAWLNFKVLENDLFQQQFVAFCTSEKEWLNDFALYSVLKKELGGKPWYDWPDEYKFRCEESIKKAIKKFHEEISEVKWLQFIFLHQWEELKKYCNDLGILLIGDLPFYISYDSSDVWSHREIFKLDADGNRTGIAGVPPDAFSADGQLWGMPVFRWDVLKERNYAWWINRLKKNWQLFDLVRLDHFRAFADYWEVPAGERTARNGEWKPGPGADFFKKVQDELGDLPFVAEDLGDINDKVIQLREEFSLPGMKILQFAFGENYSTSDYIPHNYTPNFFVYTGTHDNNTVKGWYRTEIGINARKYLEKYIGSKVTEDRVSSMLCRLAMSSVAKTAILPMQDILELNETARMNIPASGENNWSWRLLPRQITEATEKKLKEWTVMYNRSNPSNNL